jgi:D-methionine transport system substrate-binding protein
VLASLSTELSGAAWIQASFRQTRQCQPYLDNHKADRGYKIARAAYTVNFPIGIYSKKHKTWDVVPDGGTLTISRDPTNCGRVLLQRS